MNNRVNYALVGLFVLVSMGLIFGFVYWLMLPDSQNVMKPYRIYFTESVSGLNIDSSVKYRGVSVGKVSDILINPANIEEVQVDILLRQSTPVKIDTVAKLKSHGLTGLTFIELSEGSKSAPLLEDVKGAEIAVIPSVPSLFERVSESMGSVASKLTETLTLTERLLNHGNQERIAKLLENMQKSMAQIEKALNDETVRNFQELIASSASAAQKIDTLLPKADALVEQTSIAERDLNDSIRSIMQSYQVIAESFAVFKQKNESGHYSVKDNVGAPMKEFELTMREMRETLANFNEMLRKYEHSPSDALFVHEEPNIGPGER